jgi:DoxX-like family
MTEHGTNRGFLFAGGTKLILPIEEMTKQVPLPGAFLRFVGVAEVFGAISLILPGLLRIRQGLTPLAAAALAMITIGAAVLTVTSSGVAPAVFPFVVGMLLAFVAYGRWTSAGQERVTRPVDPADLGSTY